MPSINLISSKEYNLFCHGRLGAARYPVYKKLREEEPVHWSETLQTWVLTRYDDVYSGFLDPRLSAKRIPIVMSQVPDSIRTRVQPLENHFSHWLGMVDPPDHTRLRKLILLAFTPKVVERLKPKIKCIIDDLLDKVEDQAGMDIVNDFGFRLPATVICELLGVPKEDHDQFREKTEHIMNFLGGAIPTIRDTVEQSQKSLFVLKDYFNGLIEERRKHPKDDLMSSMIAVEQAGDRMNKEELMAMCIFLFFAGHETTMNLINNGFLAMFQNPSAMDRLQADPSLMPTAVDECLRYYSPLQRQIRVALEDMEIRGRKIEKGQGVMLMQGAANRDPEQFSDPDQLDITRDPNKHKHLAFGQGLHFCLGASLARMEGRIAFDTVLQRFPNIQMACKSEDLDWHTSMTFLALKSLPVKF